jgi:integral membrane sensor domain MASE1
MTVSRLRNRPSAIAAFAIAYAVALLLSERAYGSAAVPSPFWLPDSILLSALLLARTEDWWVTSS